MHMIFSWIFPVHISELPPQRSWSTKHGTTTPPTVLIKTILAIEPCAYKVLYLHMCVNMCGIWRGWRPMSWLQLYVFAVKQRVRRNLHCMWHLENRGWQAMGWRMSFSEIQLIGTHSSIIYGRMWIWGVIKSVLYLWKIMAFHVLSYNKSMAVEYQTCISS